MIAMSVGSKADTRMVVLMQYIRVVLVVLSAALLAGAALVALPMLVLFGLLSRYFVQGLTAGGVKG
jgi:ABC-type maltose transport system permease subunit